MYAVVRTDKMYGTDNRAGMVSVRYQPSGTMTAIDNGNVVKLDGLESHTASGATVIDSREVFKGATPAASDALKDIVLIATPEVVYESGKRALDDFTNKAGEIARGYRLHQGDIFSVTKDALDGVATPDIGNVVELKAGTKLNVAASATSGSTVVGKIIDINVVGRFTFYAIMVD
jgi:hypothetical protein